MTPAQFERAIQLLYGGSSARMAEALGRTDRAIRYRLERGTPINAEMEQRIRDLLRTRVREIGDFLGEQP